MCLIWCYAVLEAAGGRFTTPDQPKRGKSKAWAPPVVANGRLYLRDQDVLLCYDLRAAKPKEPEPKPKERWRWSSSCRASLRRSSSSV